MPFTDTWASGRRCHHQVRPLQHTLLLQAAAAPPRCGLLTSATGHFLSSCPNTTRLTNCGCFGAVEPLLEAPPLSRSSFSFSGNFSYRQGSHAPQPPCRAGDPPVIALARWGDKERLLTQPEREER